MTKPFTVIFFAFLTGGLLAVPAAAVREPVAGVPAFRLSAFNIAVPTDIRGFQGPRPEGAKEVTYPVEA